MVVLGCATEDGGTAPAGGNNTPPPDRKVVTDFDPASLRDAGGTVVGTGVWMVGTTPPGADAAPRPDAFRPTPGVDGPVTTTCNLVTQDCPREACYPGPDGLGVCLPPGARMAGEACEDHAQCGRGLVCVEVFGAGLAQCARACDLRSPACGTGSVCQPVPGVLTGFGYCTL